jgi:hypothetical protein
MFRSGALFVALAVAVPFASKAQTTTTCNTFVPGTINCQTQGLPQQNSVDPTRWARLFQEQQAQQQQQFQQNMIALRRQEVGRLIATGQCDQARDTALRQGDFELAQQASSLCEAQVTQRRAAVDAQIATNEQLVALYLGQHNCPAAIQAAQPLGVNRQIEIERACAPPSSRAEVAPAPPATAIASAAPATSVPSQSAPTPATPTAKPATEVSHRRAAAPKARGCIRVLTDPSQNSC